MYIEMYFRQFWLLIGRVENPEVAGRSGSWRKLSLDTHSCRVNPSIGFPEGAWRRRVPYPWLLCHMWALCSGELTVWYRLFPDKITTAVKTSNPTNWYLFSWPRNFLFLWNRYFIIVFRAARCCTLSWTSWIHSTLSSPFRYSRPMCAICSNNFSALIYLRGAGIARSV
jgi:hypothetical protein